MPSRALQDLTVIVLCAQEAIEEKKPSTATATVDEEDESTIDIDKARQDPLSSTELCWYLSI